MSSIACERRDDGVVVLTLDAPGASVNTMDAAFKAELVSVVERLIAEREGLRGIIVRSAKSSFFAGGNLREISSVRPDQGAPFFEGLQRMKSALRRFETFGVPSVALLNGHALGGGFELALSCHHRIAVDDDRIQLGCPEATLGLLPGAGGVAKLVRLLGVERALPYLVEGRRISPREASTLGLVDALVGTADALMEAALAWLATNPRPVQPWDREAGSGTGTSHPPGARPEPIPARDDTHGSPVDGDSEQELTAAQAIRRAAEEGAQRDFETALLLESQYLTRLVTGRYARNMIGTLFFQMNELRSGAGRPHDEPRHPIAVIGIVASDATAVPLAMRCAERGIACRIHPVAHDAARTVETLLARNETARQPTVPASSASGRPRAAINLVEKPEALADCDLIVDARTHPVDTAPALPEWLAAPASMSALSSDTILASTDCSAPVSQLARSVAHPERLIGLVFAEPHGKMPLVEIVRGARSGPAAVARAFDLVLQIGGLPIVVSDSPDRFVSRVSRSFLIEAMALLGEGVAAATVEEAALNAGMAAGPLAMLDEGAFESIDREHHAHEHHGHGHEHHGHEHHGHEHHGHEHHGHEHCGHEHRGHEHHAHEHHGHEHHGHEHHAHEHHGHEHHHHEHHGHNDEASGGPAQLPESAVYVLEKMAHGFHRSGRRQGGGFYDHADDGSRELWPGLSAFVRKSRRTPSADEATDRLLYIQAIETLRCLQEGVIASTRDANIGSIFGWGFPERTGGTAQFVNHVGVTRFVERARELAQRHGARFEPPALVLRLAADNHPL